MKKITKSLYYYFIFFLSPIFSLLFLFVNSYQQKRNSILLTVFFFSLLSYYYVPYSFFDKVDYYDFYNQHLHYSFGKFLNEVLILKTDFIVYIIIYIFSLFGFSFHLASALITGITIWCYLTVFYSITQQNRISDKVYFFYFILFLFSISYFHLLTGIRYFFASGFIIKGFYAIYTEQNKRSKVLYFSLGVLSHFGTILFLPFVLLYTYLKERQIKLLFIVSTIFIFLARELLYNFFSISLFDGLYGDKLDTYLGANDFIEKQLLNDSVYYEYKVMLTLGIHIVMLTYLIINLKSKSRFYLMTLAFFIIGNLVSSAPTIFERVSLINTVFMFILFLITHKDKNILSKIIVTVFLGFIFLLFMLDYFLLFASYMNSYNWIDFLIFPNIFFNQGVKYY